MNVAEQFRSLCYQRNAFYCLFASVCVCVCLCAQTISGNLIVNYFAVSRLKLNKEWILRLQLLCICLFYYVLCALCACAVCVRVRAQINLNFSIYKIMFVGGYTDDLTPQLLLD